VTDEESTVSCLKSDDAGTAAAGDEILDADALESTLQQTVRALCTKQQQLEDEQKQVNTAFLNIHYHSHLITVTEHFQEKAVNASV